VLVLGHIVRAQDLSVTRVAPRAGHPGCVGKHLKPRGVVNRIIEERGLKAHVAIVAPAVPGGGLFVEGKDVVVRIKTDLAKTGR